jgi:hypothetical protein
LARIPILVEVRGVSLKVWLPLNGTLENKGVSNVVPTIASGNSWTSTGKIGAGAITLTKQ